MRERSGPAATIEVRRAKRRFFARGAEALARSLLGCRLVRVLDGGERLSGIIVEVEAYVGVEDGAAHSFGGRHTARNHSMYLRAGTAYVYFTYGMHHCFNIVCGREGEPVAVLVRALEPVEGLGVMRGRRGRVGLKDHELCRGPGNLSRALAIDRALDGVDLAEGGRLWVERGKHEGEVERGARIGLGPVGAWAEAPLRFWIKGNRSVSRT